MAEPPSRNASVLLLLSRDLHRERLDRALTAAGHDVRSTTSAAIGLGLAWSWRPQILVVDERSPLALSDLATLLASEPSHPSTRTILLTDRAVERPQDRGADRVVPASAGAPALLASIAQLLTEPSSDR